MNRWQGWAQRLRARHGRIATWGAPGTMVLMRGHGAPAQVLHTHVRSSLHLHLRVAVPPRSVAAMRPVPAPILRHTTIADGVKRAWPAAVTATAHAVARTEGHGARGTGIAAPTLASVLSVLRRGDQARPAPVGRAPARLPVRRATWASPVAAQAAATALRIRRNAVREDARPAAHAVVLARPQPAVAQAAGGQPHRVDAVVPAGTQREEAGAAQIAQAAINVEALAGMVIQQIDRRLVAYRERMGRT